MEKVDKGVGNLVEGGKSSAVNREEKNKQYDRQAEKNLGKSRLRGGR